ncbi:FitA-like ribbon-helix-helix domain-containing protein [Glaciimonas sp. GG7]
MSEVMTIKQMPADLKRYWAEEAKRHDRSMNKEVLRVLEEERARRETAKVPGKDMDSIMVAASRLQSFALIDQRPIEEILYDEEGMPK